jgi:ATP sulfurylase
MIYKLLLEMQQQNLPSGKSRLKELVSTGIVPIKVLTYFEIYQFYLEELEKNRREKNCVMQSVSNTAEEFRILERTVFRAIKFNQTEC